MVSLVFHGGHYKTGTTSLQHTLRASEAGLRKAGILYPSGPADGQFSDVQHADLLSDCFSGRHERVESYLTETVKTATAQSCRTVLLSSELATSFHQFPEQFTRWSEMTGRLFDDVRYVFVVRDVAGYAVSMYRELVKSGRASFHFDSVKGALAEHLCAQQHSIKFFRKWDKRRVKLLSFRALADRRLVRDLARALVKFEIDPAAEAHLNASDQKAQNIPALLLNDVYALVGAHLGQDALSVQVRKIVHGAVKRGRLRRAFDDEFAARVEQAFLDVPLVFVRRVFEAEQKTIARSLKGLPARVRDWLAPAGPNRSEAELD